MISFLKSMSSSSRKKPSMARPSYGEERVVVLMFADRDNYGFDEHTLPSLVALKRFARNSTATLEQRLQPGWNP